MSESLIFLGICGLGVLAGVACLGILLLWLVGGRERRKRKPAVLLVLVVTVIGAGVLGAFLLKPPVKRDLSLDGGYKCTLQVSEKTDDDGNVIRPDPLAMEQSIETIRNRLDRIGHEDARIQLLGGGHIRVELYGANIEEADLLERVVVKPARLELRLVHPESASKASLVKAGEVIVPGFTYYEGRYVSDDGEELTEDLLLSKRVQVEGKHVKYAAPDASQPGVVNIRLNGEGGDRMIQMTKNLTPGRSRIAVVLDDEVMSAPVVQSVPLGSSFIIEGLADYDEANDLAAALMNPLEFPIEILELTHVTAVASDGSRARRLAGGWSRIEYVVGIIVGSGVVGLGVITLAIMALGTNPMPDATRNQASPPMPGDQESGGSA